MTAAEGSDATASQQPITRLHVVAANLAVIVATVHLALGAYNWYRYASYGIYWPPDPRWPLFVISGLAILVAIAAIARGWPRRPFYLGGIALMVGYLLGYFWWHIGGHRFPFAPGPRSHHDASLAGYLIDHVTQVPVYTQLTLAAELLLIIGLAALYLREPGGH